MAVHANDFGQVVASLWGKRPMMRRWRGAGRRPGRPHAKWECSGNGPVANPRRPPNQAKQAPAVVASSGNSETPEAPMQRTEAALAPEALAQAEKPDGMSSGGLGSGTPGFEGPPPHRGPIPTGEIPVACPRGDGPK